MTEELQVKRRIARLIAHKATRWLAFALFLLIPGSLLLLPLVALVRCRMNVTEAG